MCRTCTPSHMEFTTPPPPPPKRKPAWLHPLPAWLHPLPAWLHPLPAWLHPLPAWLHPLPAWLHPLPAWLHPLPAWLHPLTCLAPPGSYVHTSGSDSSRHNRDHAIGYRHWRGRGEGLKVILKSYEWVAVCSSLTWWSSDLVV